MPSAAALRLQIETALASRIPGALTPRPRILRDLAATGIPELDALLEGGLPIGAISELVGKHSSGRTTIALAARAEKTQESKPVAWVDTSDALDPESAAAAGVDLSRLLWVRCGQAPRAESATGPLPNATAPQKGAAFLVEGSGSSPALSGGGGGSPHPRGEARGLSEAVNAFLHPDVFSRQATSSTPATPRKNRIIGTPGAPNRKLLDRTPQDARPLPRRARDREEQIPSDRQPSRRQVHQALQHTTAQRKDLSSAQIDNTAHAARNRPQAGAWTDNGNNAAGRCLATPPNAIAAGLPRFCEMEARAQSQGHSVAATPVLQAEVKTSQKTLSSPEAISSATLPLHTIANLQTAKLEASPAGALRPAISNSSESKHRVNASLAGDPSKALGNLASALWRALDHALRATDLLLAAGGFTAIVLDLGNIPPEFAWRIPLATWFRFRAAADRARTVLLVLTQHPCARSSAELVLRLRPAEPLNALTVLTGAQFCVSVDRYRFETPAASSTTAQSTQPNRLHLVTSRKQPQRDALWRRAAAWTGTEPKNPQEGPL